MTLKAPYIFINGCRISNEEPPFIIAELSANHNGNIETAFKIIEQAKNSGADAVKLQTYHPDTMTIDCDQEDFRINGGLWGGRTLYELYQEAHTPWDWHEPLFEHARNLDITIFSSPFDSKAVDLLENLNAPAYKIASFELVDLPLIKYVAATGKPMMLSTGMADAIEIQEAIDTAREGGCKEMAILHCVSSYPAPAKDYNLRVIPDMIQRFGLVTGLSDHTLGNTTAIASIAMGASIIEKHFTLDRSRGGPDDSFSLEPEELRHLCEDSKAGWESLGEVNYERKESEKENVKFRRSLYVVKDIKAGEIITKENVKSIRPGFGLAPKFYEQVLGCVVTRTIRRGTPLSLEYFK
jgi:pseudaminic acid synthase